LREGVKKVHDTECGSEAQRGAFGNLGAWNLLMEYSGRNLIRRTNLKGQRDVRRFFEEF